MPESEIKSLWNAISLITLGILAVMGFSIIDGKRIARLEAELADLPIPYIPHTHVTTPAPAPATAVFDIQATGLDEPTAPAETTAPKRTRKAVAKAPPQKSDPTSPELLD